MNARELWSSLVPSQPSSILRVLAIAVVSLLFAVCLRLPFETWLAGTVPYATFFPAVLIGTLLGGGLAGALVLIAGGPLALELFGGEVMSRPVASLVIWFTNGVLIFALALGVRQLVVALHRHEDELAVAHRQLQSVVSELQHRTRNTFAVIMAIVRQTSRDAGSVSMYRERLTERLTALGRAHDLLTGEQWQHVELAAVLDAALRPFRQTGDGRIQLEAGSSCVVAPGLGMSLTLAMHELATNALKYGALSGSSGIVRCGWRIEEGRVRLHWRECGGPKVIAPSHTGLGSRLIRDALAVEDGGAVELKFEPDGVECLLSFRAVEIEPAPVPGRLSASLTG